MAFTLLKAHFCPKCTLFLFARVDVLRKPPSEQVWLVACQSPEFFVAVKGNAPLCKLLEKRDKNTNEALSKWKLT